MAARTPVLLARPYPSFLTFRMTVAPAAQAISADLSREALSTTMTSST
jgi:hypothetical protein